MSVLNLVERRKDRDSEGLKRDREKERESMRDRKGKNINNSNFNIQREGFTHSRSLFEASAWIKESYRGNFQNVT